MQIDHLRRTGPAAFDALLARLATATPTEVPHLRDAIDRVAGQRDADASKLYWYTDLEQAKAAAKTRGVPILSLRLLGRLDEEMSCANSRFFRTALYANETVSKALRERFVLHWSTEREAPLLTIDFRDGRKVERTITGNSLHYVLDEEGRVLDAIPGLYGPQSFLAALGDAEGLNARVKAAGSDRYDEIVKEHHRERAAGLDTRWRREVAQLGFGEVEPPVPVRSPDSATPPPAAVAMSLAMPKAMVEMPVLASTKLGAVRPRPRGRVMSEKGDVNGSADPETVFEVMAKRARSLAKLDDSSRALLTRKRPMSWTDPKGPRPLVGKELEALIRSFEEQMAIDTVKNEYRFHARIHTWLAQDTVELAELNARIYEELFLTPASDPWLGLVPPQAYTGLDGDGLVD